MVVAEITRFESPAAFVRRVIAPDIEREERNREIRAAALLRSQEQPAAPWFRFGAVGSRRARQ